MAEKEEKVENQKTAFTEEELAGLSDAEREALESKDEDLDALRTIAGEGGDDDDDKDAAAKAAREKAEAEAAAAAKAKEDAAAKAAEEAEAKKRIAELAKMSAEDRAKAEAEDLAKADAAAAAKAKADAEAKAAADAKARADAEEDEPLITTYRAEPPENYDAKVKALDERKDAATAKYKANEMELDEMLAEHTAADAERRKLDEQKLKAEIAAESSEQASDQRWRWECKVFVREVLKHESIDYQANAGLWGALDAEVRALGNDEKTKDWTGRQFLEEAHKRVKAQTGLAKPAAAQDEAAKQKAAAEAEAKRKAELERQKRADANREKLPKSVTGLPAAGAGEVANEGEFANLDGLDGMELEYAVAKLTPEQQDRYSRTS